jgi:hypothetical protein
MRRVAGLEYSAGNRSRSASLKRYPMIVFTPGQSMMTAAALHSISGNECPMALIFIVRDFPRLADIVINLSEDISRYILIAQIAKTLLKIRNPAYESGF